MEADRARYNPIPGRRLVPCGCSQDATDDGVNWRDNASEVKHRRREKVTARTSPRRRWRRWKIDIFIARNEFARVNESNTRRLSVVAVDRVRLGNAHVPPAWPLIHAACSDKLLDVSALYVDWTTVSGHHHSTANCCHCRTYCINELDHEDEHMMMFYVNFLPLWTTLQIDGLAISSVCPRLSWQTKPCAAMSMHHRVGHHDPLGDVDQVAHATVGWSKSVKTLDLLQQTWGIKQSNVHGHGWSDGTAHGGICVDDDDDDDDDMCEMFCTAQTTSLLGGRDGVFTAVNLYILFYWPISSDAYLRQYCLIAELLCVKHQYIELPRFQVNQLYKLIEFLCCN